MEESIKKEGMVRLTYEVDGVGKVIYERGKDAYRDKELLKWLEMIYIGLGYGYEDIRRMFIDWLVSERMISSDNIEELKKEVSCRERELNSICSMDCRDDEFNSSKKIDECIHGGIGSIYGDANLYCGGSEKYIDKGIKETYKKMKIID